MEDENKLTTIAITLLGIVAVIAIIFSGGNAVVTQEQPIGGLVHNVKEIFKNGLTAEGTLTAKDATFSTTVAVTGESNLDTLVQGGDVTVLTAGTTTVTAAYMCNSIILQHDSNGANVPVTTPTAALLVADCVPTAGDSFEFYYENTGGEHDTITAGSNIELLEPTGGDVIIEDTEWAHFLVVNEDGTNVTIVVTSLQNAD